MLAVVHATTAQRERLHPVVVDQKRMMMARTTACFATLACTGRVLPHVGHAPAVHFNRTRTQCRLHPASIVPVERS